MGDVTKKMDITLSKEEQGNVGHYEPGRQQCAYSLFVPFTMTRGGSEAAAVPATYTVERAIRAGFSRESSSGSSGSRQRRRTGGG